MKNIPVINEGRMDRLIKRVVLVKDCWEWSGWRNEDGYGKLRINGSAFFAHRVFFTYFNGEITEEKPCVLHKCDNPACVNPMHLFAGTHEENMHDMKDKGRAKSGRYKGQPHKNKKLTDLQVKSILNDSRTQQVIAKEYGVSQSLVSKIKLRTAWGHL